LGATLPLGAWRTTKWCAPCNSLLKQWCHTFVR